MSDKKYGVLLTALFCAFIGGICIVSLLLPKKEFSELENRYLSDAPEFSLEALKDGSFMEDSENFTADHIVGRDFWVSMKSWCERFTGKQENNGVYFAEGGALINRVDTPKPEKLDKGMQALNQLAEKSPVPVHFGLIPSAAAIWKDRLPEGAPTADELTIIDKLYSGSKAENVDMAGALSAHSSEELYYRTDHHWTSLGAFYGANAIFESMSMAPIHLEDYTKTTVTDSFNGTIFSSSGVRWVQPDTIDTYVSDEGITVTSYANGKPSEGALYHPEKLEKKDKYTFFLGGNQPLCVVKAQNDGPKLLLIRDSYSDSLAPFLTERFSEVHLFDLRYNMTSIQKYIAENDIDQVLVLYSFNNFATDPNLPLLGK